MNIYLVSDCHEEFWRKSTSPKETRHWSNIPPNTDVVVLAGDIDSDTGALMNTFHKMVQDNPNTKFIFVDGNHEHYGSDYLTSKSVLAEYCALVGVIYLDNSSVVIDGKLFYGGCGWTSFDNSPTVAYDASTCISDFRRIEGFNTNQAVRENGVFLSKFPDNADVVITHFSPSRLGMDPKHAGSKLNGYFHNSFENLIVDKNPKLWLHGHVHNEVDYVLGDTRVIAHPRGYWAENYRNSWEYVGKTIEI